MESDFAMIFLWRLMHVNPARSVWIGECKQRKDIGSFVLEWVQMMELEIKVAARSKSAEDRRETRSSKK